MPTNAIVSICAVMNNQKGFYSPKGGNSLGNVPSWQRLPMMPPLSKAVVGVATNQETPSPAMILIWMDETVWFLLIYLITSMT